MRTDNQLRVMAMTLRGVLASRCTIMFFTRDADNFNERWDSLSKAVRDEWIALANTIDTLYDNELFRKDIPRNTNETY